MNPSSCVGNGNPCFNDQQCGVVDGQCNCPTSGCFAAGTCANDSQQACDSGSDCGCGRINDWLTTQRNADQGLDPGFDPDRRYVSMVHDVGGLMRGCSPGVTRKVAAGPTGDPSGTAFDWDIDAS